MAGRRVQDVPHRVRMDVGEDSETILQTLPKQKPQPKRHLAKCNQSEFSKCEETLNNI